MPNVIVVVREPGKLKPDYSLEFQLPEVPAVGSYLSVHRPSTASVHGEDLIVRKIWWRLEHPETAPTTTNPKSGSLIEIMIECEIAEGPYSSNAWRRTVGHARQRGVKVEEFEVDRIGGPESEFSK